MLPAQAKGIAVAVKKGEQDGETENKTTSAGGEELQRPEVEQSTKRVLRRKCEDVEVLTRTLSRYTEFKFLV